MVDRAPIVPGYAFAIDFGKRKSDDNVGVVLEHYSSAKGEVRLDAGDRAEVDAYASLWPRPGYTGMVRARITDTNGRQYLSRNLAVCAATETSSGVKRVPGSQPPSMVDVLDGSPSGE